MGFEEIPHTADWCVRVWSEDLKGLFIEAARAMYHLTGIKLNQVPRVKHEFSYQASEPESLLIAFLSELVYYLEHDKVAFEKFDLSLQDERLFVAMEGAQIDGLNKAIKAVTWHNLKIVQTLSGLETEIVFDV